MRRIAVLPVSIASTWDGALSPRHGPGGILALQALWRSHTCIDYLTLADTQ